MRELTKSLLTFSWTMSLFGIKQFSYLLSPPEREAPGAKAKEAFEALSSVAQQQFGETLQQTFKAGDDLQRRMVDVMYSFLGSGGLDPNRMMRATTDAAKRAFSPAAPGPDKQPAGQQPGWGPVK